MKISVCMAVYNGGNYLHKQIDSILTQLSREDEIVVIDDASTDDCTKILEDFNDPRIKVFKNNINMGAIRSFELAISLASGEVIFLSDQDDIWMPGKVSKFNDAFNRDPEITLVISDALIINQYGQIIADSFFKSRGAFRTNPISNIVKNKYHGCALAFRREMLRHILPFPKKLPMHDMWIGIVNSIYGKVFYIDEPLMQHRRHNTNTGRGIVDSAGLIQITLWRISIIKSVFLLLTKNK